MFFRLWRILGPQGPSCTLLTNCTQEGRGGHPASDQAVDVSRTLTNGSLDLAQNLVVGNGPATLVVRDDLRLLIDFLERTCVCPSAPGGGGRRTQPGEGLRLCAACVGPGPEQVQLSRSQLSRMAPQRSRGSQGKSELKPRVTGRAGPVPPPARPWPGGGARRAHRGQVLLCQPLALPALLDHFANLQGHPVVMQLLSLPVQLSCVLGDRMLLVLAGGPWTVQGKSRAEGLQQSHR